MHPYFRLRLDRFTDLLRVSLQSPLNSNSSINLAIVLWRGLVLLECYADRLLGIAKWTKAERLAQI